MNRPLDPYFLELSHWEHVVYLRYLYFFMFALGAVGFVFYWFVALKAWVAIFKDAWENKRGLFWTSSLRNPLVRRFVVVMFKALLVHFIASWPLLLIMTGMVSADVFNVLLGYDAISGGE